MSKFDQLLKKKGVYDVYKDIKGSKTVDFSGLMGKAVDSFIMDVISNPDLKVGILYDPDVDGLFAGSILNDFLHRLNITIYTDINSGKKHGIIEEHIQWCKDLELDVFFVVDAGSGDKEYIEAISKNGTKVIVLDHHPYEKWDVPENSFVMNVTDYDELPKLSGCGVTFRFIELLGERLMIMTDKYKKYVGITVLSDIVSMLEPENRYYVDELFTYFDNNKDEDKLFRQFSFYGSKKGFFSFSLIPYFNGLIRIGRERKAVELVNNLESFAKMNTIKADIKRVKDRQRELSDEILEVSKIIETEHTVILYRKDRKDLNTVNGLVANKILNEYNKNTMVLVGNPETNTWGGSFRGKTYTKEDMIEFGIEAYGHSYACGVYMSPDKLKDFIRNFVDESSELSDVVEHDITISNVSFDESLLLDIAHYNDRAFSGTGLEPISIRIDGMEKGVEEVVSYERKRVYRTGKLYFTEFGLLDLDKEVKNLFDVVLQYRSPYYELINRS